MMLYNNWLIRILLLFFMITTMSTQCDDTDPDLFMTIANNTDERIVIFEYEARMPLEIDENKYFFECMDSIVKYDDKEDRIYSLNLFLDDYLGVNDYSFRGDATFMLILLYGIKPQDKRNLFYTGKIYPNSIYVFRIYKESTLRRYTREEIIENDICDKRLFFTGEKLYQMGGVIEIN